MTIVGLRYFNVYGPREFYKAKTSSMIIQLGHQILSGITNVFEDVKSIIEILFILMMLFRQILKHVTKKNGVIILVLANQEVFKI